jgi:hypothetical protein
VSPTEFLCNSSREEEEEEEEEERRWQKPLRQQNTISKQHTLF